MKKTRVLTILMSVALALLVPVSSFAISLNEAAQQAARQHNAKVLSARTINQNGQRVHEIKLLTKSGVVKTVHIRDNG
jgi:uncharacterized membrane protein YkoI